MSLECRFASLLAFLESRDRQLGLAMGGCERNPDGTFATNNDCAAGGGRGGPSPYASLPDSMRLTPNGSSVNYTAEQLKYGSPFASTAKAASLTIASPGLVMKTAKKAGIKDPSDVAVIGAAGAAGSRVSIYGYGDEIEVATTTPIDPKQPKLGLAQVNVEITSAKVVRYSYFSPDRTAFESLAAGSLSTRTISASVMALMSQSLEAAERNGMKKAVTSAAGRGSGEFSSGPDGDLQGYRLWPKFGFDGPVNPSTADRFVDLPNSPSLLTTEARRRYTSTRTLNVQDIVSTKEGEEWWNKNGHGLKLAFDFKDKESIGYKRYERMLVSGKKAAARLAREGRSVLEFWGWVAENAGMPSFEEFERRAFCPTGTGNGVDNSCSSSDRGGSYEDLPPSLTDPNNAGELFSAGNSPFKSTAKAESVTITRPAEVISLAKELGIKSPSDIGVIGAATAKGSHVKIDAAAYSSGRRITVNTKSPIDPSDASLGKADVQVVMKENKSVYYSYFSPDPTTFESIANGRLSTSTISASILSLMSSSLEAAERNGFDRATTTAVGNGTGSFSGTPAGDFQGYRLWPKFGFDGLVDTPVAARYRQEMQQPGSGPLSVQEIVQTKPGEDWWHKHGHDIELSLTFDDKNSLGYKRYQRMLLVGKQAAKRLAKEGRSSFEFWLWVAENAGVPSFEEFERRAFCPTGSGGGVDNSCGASPADGPADVVKSLRGSDGSQTRVARKLYAMGMSERKLAEMITKMGGSPRASQVKRNLDGLVIYVKDKGGKQLYHIDFNHKGARIYRVGKDAVSGDIAKVAKDAFPAEYDKKGVPFKIEVHDDPKAFDAWKKENAAKYKAIEDKYIDSPLLPPHRRPKPVDARYASLLAFAQSRNCGQESDGKFSKGNTCASGIAADAAAGAAKGAAVGAVGGFAKTFLPQGAASGAAAGAIAGAVKGIYDNQMRPTRVSKRIESLGLTDDKVASLVKGLGGTSKSLASVNGRSGLTLTIRAKNGSVAHVVDITPKSVSVYPRSAKKEMTDSQIDAIKQIAKDNAPKQTTITVKTNSLSYASRLSRKGFVVSAKGAGVIVATAVSGLVGPSVPDAVLGYADLVFDTHFTDSFYEGPKRAKRG